MGCMVSAVSTLGDGGTVLVCKTTLGVDAWDVGSNVVSTLGSGAAVPVCETTLGVDAWDAGSDCECGGLKMARRLSTARSCAWQLLGVRSARMATVSAQRHWMTLSVVVSVWIDSVGC